MTLLGSIGERVGRLLGRPRQIGEEEFKTWRRESFDPVTRSGARERYDFVGFPRNFLSVRFGSSSSGPVGSTM